MTMKKFWYLRGAKGAMAYTTGDLPLLVISLKPHRPPITMLLLMAEYTFLPALPPESACQQATTDRNPCKAYDGTAHQ